MDKSGGRPISEASSREMQQFMLHNGLVDLKFPRPMYTWSNKRFGTTLIQRDCIGELQIENGGFFSQELRLHIVRELPLTTRLFFLTLIEIRIWGPDLFVFRLYGCNTPILARDITMG